MENQIIKGVVMIQLRLEWDELYPYYELQQKINTSDEDFLVTLTTEEYHDYQKTVQNFFSWQNKLRELKENHIKKRKI